jgi:glutamate/tyrosine decarboxylase-like PLP-dependent enzyme
MGRSGATALVCRHRALARRLAALADAAPDLERLAPVELSVVCFRYAPSDLGGNDAALDALNKRLVETIQAEGRVFVTSTVVKGRAAIRACILHYGTAEADVQHLVDVVRDTGERCRRSAPSM